MCPVLPLRTFSELFGGEPVVVRAPGRINLIGEHTDYNEGYVLPAAIDKAIYVAACRRADEQVHVFSMKFNERVVIGPGDIKPAPGHWSNCILGVVHVLRQRGYSIGGFDAVVYSEVPPGAGMSSSAALECAMVLIMNELFGLGLSRWNMVLAAQHAFPGVQCAVTDMFASVFGRKGHVVKLDCQASVHEYVPLDMENYSIVLFDTNVKHGSVAAACNQRRVECAEGLQLVRESYPHVVNLRDATLQMLQQCIPCEEVRRRCIYVVKENARVLAACGDLKIGDFTALGQKLFQTHQGLSKEYEVSCRELDYLVSAVKNMPGVAGARMMGGGFGGCTINLVEKRMVERISCEVKDYYQRYVGRKLDIHIVETADGAALTGAGVIKDVS